MDIKIKASEKFKQVLEMYNGEIKVRRIEEVPFDGTFNAKIDGSALIRESVFYLSINIVSGVSVNFITDAIKNYINTNQETVVVTTTEERFVITPSNVNELIPMLNWEFSTAFIDDKNGKIR